MLNDIVVNYWADRYRSTAINIVFARVLMGIYGIYSIAIAKGFDSYTGLGYLPWARLYETRLQYFSHVGFAIGLSLIAVVALVGFTLGRAIRLTAFVSAVALVSIQLLYVPSPQPNPHLGILALLLITYAVCYLPSQHHLRPENPPQRKQSVDHLFLTVALLLLGFGYAVDAINKFRYTGLDWVLDPANMRLYVHTAVVRRDHEPVLAGFFLNYDWVNYAATIGTIILELGFISLIFLKRVPLVVPVFGLLMMHISIALTMHIYYVWYFPPIYLLFVGWDRLLLGAPHWVILPKRVRMRS